jgi:hypothetical protein
MQASIGWVGAVNNPAKSVVCVRIFCSYQMSHTTAPPDALRALLSIHLGDEHIQ